MANTKYILEQIKIGDDFEDLIAKSNGENVTVTYDGKEMSLSDALAKIITGNDVETKIQAAINGLIDGAPNTYDTLKEIADYIAEDKDGAAALTQEIAGKVGQEAFNALKDTVDNLSDHSHDNKDVLDGITGQKVQEWDNKADATEATESAAGLMSPSDKKRLNAVRGVRYGTTPPADMQEGELFVRVVSEK